ncbi:hypothetical protein [Marinilactibacillus psychrotolerans]|uniref:hypothetical protein n=1 Tax=Marinilactibacillus psychrotolerans TaxID=191770 RepID=UPI003889DB7E
MKWQGLILTHQTDAIKALEQEYAKLEAKAKEEMTIEAISEVLYNAYVSKKPVIIQANVLKNGKFYPDVFALVIGHLNDKIVLQIRLKDGSEVIKKVSLNLIRNVELYDVLKWNNKIK